MLEYEIFGGRRLLGRTLQPRYVVSGLAEGMSYTFTVRARDLAGNVSRPSPPITVTTATSEAGADVAVVKQIKEAPVIDGQIDAVWARQIPYALQRPMGGPPRDAADLAARFRAAWDQHHLYVLVEVTDDRAFPPPAAPTAGTRATDGVRVFLDPGHDQAPHFGRAHRQYRLSKDAPLREAIQRDENVKGVRTAIGPAAPSRGSSAGAGYTVEMAYPWSALGVPAPQPGALVGFDVLVDDDDDGASVRGSVAWVGAGVGGARLPDFWPPGGDRTASSPARLGRLRLVRELPSGSASGPLPPQIWAERQGVVVVEAEDISHHHHWALRTTPAGYTGKGRLVWTGPNRTRTPDGRGGNDDHTRERQGPQEEWLVVRVLVETPGHFVLDARNLHAREDGDNDAWLWRVGRPLADWAPVERIGDSHKDGTGFTWLDWGQRVVWLRPGVNDLVIGGRSVGFSLDRIVLYRQDFPAAKARALDPATPPSPDVGTRAPDRTLPAKPVALGALPDGR